ncbi:amidase family protein [Qaidamihabitans albus]|uniref:amidase family protein n=1 Tax=Qaidamihabitans albus TaxID=2795733 RepID=UPI001F16C0E0|nr:amidase family protein [Qaidamihabitans albus]
MNRADIEWVEWSEAAWRVHVPGADESFASGLGNATLPALAHASARKFPDRIALDIDGETVTHGELDADAARIAGWLSDRIGPGDRVVLSGPSSTDFVRCYLATLRAGGVVVPANPAATAAELGHLFADSSAALALVADPEATPPGIPAQPLHAVPRGRPLPATSSGPDEVALLAYTSGTTGRPKGVPLSHRRLLTSIRAAMAAWRWSADDVLVHALPLFHQHGLGGVHATLVAGSTARLLSRFTTDALVRAARGATVLFAVPTMYERLVDAPGATDVLGALRLCVCGSAPLSEALAARVAATFGRPPLVRYGTTETGLDVSNPYGAARADTVGLPLPGVLLRLVDDEIQLRGPQVFSGYWNNQEATAEAFTADGWFRTGDLGQIDPGSGHLVIRGRSKELIITGGLNVYPREVEVALERHPAVAEAAVAGLPHEHWGEQVTAWVVLREAVPPEALIEHARSLLAPYKCPKVVLPVAALPRNHMGKVARAELDTPAGRALRRAEETEELGAFVELYPHARARPGTPVAVKDVVDVAGQMVRSGTPGLGHRVASEDSDAWARLRAAGYVLIGRTRLPELAWSVVTPGCRNPWDPGRDAGGSSGGSAVAVATGVVPVALGTDTGGSIRIPAALCGVAGLRPTAGAVSSRGVTPLASSMDTVGPIARTARECLRVHEVLGGAVRPAPPHVTGLTVGVPSALWTGRIDAEVARLLDAASDSLRATGARVVEIELPLAHRHARGAGYTIMLAESARHWWAELRACPGGAGAEVAERLRAGNDVSEEDYTEARARAGAVRDELDDAFTEVHALLTPTVPVTAAPLGAGTVRLGDRDEPVESAYYRLTAVASVTGHPALTVPAGLSASGLPVGAQLVGPRNQEALLCLLGEVIENGPETLALARRREGSTT